MLGLLRRLRSQPRPVRRPSAFAVAGESWRAFVPSEPMTDRQAAGVHETRELLATNPEARRHFEGMRNSPRPLGGLAVASPSAHVVLRDLLS